MYFLSLVFLELPISVGIVPYLTEIFVTEEKEKKMEESKIKIFSYHLLFWPQKIFLFKAILNKYRSFKTE